MLGAIPYPQMYMPEDESYHPTRHQPRTMFVDGVDQRGAGTIMEQLGASDATMRARSSGSSAALSLASRPTRPRSRTETARSWRTWPPSYDSPDQGARHEAWVQAFHDAMLQGDDGAYVNFVNDEGTERVHDAYPGPTVGASHRDQDPVRPGPTCSA